MLGRYTMVSSWPLAAVKGVLGFGRSGDTGPSKKTSPAAVKPPPAKRQRSGVLEIAGGKQQPHVAPRTSAPARHQAQQTTKASTPLKPKGLLGGSLGVDSRIGEGTHRHLQDDAGKPAPKRPRQHEPGRAPGGILGCTSKPAGKVTCSGVPGKPPGVLGGAGRAPCRVVVKDGGTAPGSVEESAAQHAARHPVPLKDCARCCYNSARTTLERNYGSYARVVGGQIHRTVWLTPKPPRLGGLWGVGCAFCANLRQTRADARDNARREGGATTKNLRRGPGNADTRWARFEIQQPSQIAVRGVRQHAETVQHRLAVRAYFVPQIATLVESEAAESDRDLFRGGVPQVQDWLRAWRVCRTPQSFSAAEAHGITENFIKGSRIPGVSRKAFAALVRVMCFALRLRKRAALRRAKAISLALDDRGGYRVAVFRSCSEDGTISTGCLAVLRRGGGFSEKHLEDADEDYSKAMADSIIRGIERLATCPRTHTVDAEFVDKVCAIVFIAVSDGAAAAQKCLKFLATGRMQHMYWVGRDRAHAARIATSGPLWKEQKFGEWFGDVFSRRHALVPDIKNSEEWLAKLTLCEKLVFQSSGDDEVFRSVGIKKMINFAKQRYDSMGTPQLQFCTMLLPIAMLLAFVSSDCRQPSDVRERARRRLRELPDQVAIAGLSASYSDEMIRFIRLFDCGDHDPALTYRQSLRFLSRVRVLFLEGRIWDQDEKDSPLALALRHARESQPLYYDEDGKILHLYRKLTTEQARELSDAVQAITTSMMDRIKAEFPSDDLGVLFSCFDLLRWYEASESMKSGDSTKYLLLKRHAESMFKGWKLPYGSGVRELNRVAFKLLDREKEHLRAEKPRNNRVVWAEVLRPGVLEENDMTDTMKMMLYIYLAALDSTCGVERDLGALTRVLKAHSGPVDDDATTIAACCEVLLDGPHTEKDVAEQSSGVPGEQSSPDMALLPTDFTRECAALWVDLHGRRFRVYKPGRKPGPTRKRTTGMASLKRRVKSALDRLASRGSDGPGEPAASSSTILGLPRTSFVRKPGQENPARKALAKFDAWTKHKHVMAIKLLQARKWRGNPYGSPDLDPRRKLRRGKVITGHQLPASVESRLVKKPPGGSITVLDSCKEPAPVRDGFVLSRPAVAAGSLLQQVRSGVQVVLMDSPWQCDNLSQCTGEGVLAVSFLAVALGKPTLSLAEYLHCSSHGPQNRALVMYRPVYRTTKLSINFSDGFQRESPLLHDLIRRIVQMKESLWEVTGEAEGADARLKTRQDVRALLFQIRRASHAGGGVLGGKRALSRP